MSSKISYINIFHIFLSKPKNGNLFSSLNHLNQILLVRKLARTAKRNLVCSQLADSFLQEEESQEEESVHE